MLAVGGAEEDGTVIELERIEETAHRALDLIVHVVMVDGNQLGHELVELRTASSRDRRRSPAGMDCKATLEARSAWDRSGSPIAVGLSRGIPDVQVESLRNERDLRVFPPECRSRPAMSEFDAHGAAYDVRPPARGLPVTGIRRANPIGMAGAPVTGKESFP